MPSSQYLNSLCQNEEEAYLCARICDLLSDAERKGLCRYSFFLNERELWLAGQAAQSMGASCCSFGGYEGASRQIFCALPSWMEPEDALPGFPAGSVSGDIYTGQGFPLVPVTFTYRKADRLSHREFLGSLMALQVKREMVGDILPGEGLCVLFVHENAAPLILSELSRIGRTGVKAAGGFDPVDLPMPRYEEREYIVSSLRLDAVTAVLTKLSREGAARAVRTGQVQVNYVGNLPGSKLLSQGDILSVRGFGKFRLGNVLGETKKGRMKIQIQKYV